MNLYDLLKECFPKPWRPYIATAVLTAACCTAYAQMTGRIAAIEADRAVRLPEFTEMKRDLGIIKIDVAETKRDVGWLRGKYEGNQK